MHWKDLRAAGEANNGSMAWMPGENLLITASGSAPLSARRKPSQTSSKIMLPTKSLSKHTSISRKRTRRFDADNRDNQCLELSRNFRAGGLPGKYKPSDALSGKMAA